MKHIDVVLRLRELRRIRNVSQRNLARLSGVGEKSISSFETGKRAESLKVSQLERMLAVYGVTPEQFFADDFEEAIARAATAPARRSRRPTLFDYAHRVLEILLAAKRDGFSFRTVLDEASAILDSRRLAEMGRALRGAA